MAFCLLVTSQIFLATAHGTHGTPGPSGTNLLNFTRVFHADVWQISVKQILIFNEIEK